MTGDAASHVERSAFTHGAVSPSRWSRRLPLAILGLVGATIAGYLLLYQIGAVRSVWDPLFGDGSERVLHAAPGRLVPVPVAALGLTAYAVQVATGLLGGSERWRRQPWAVLLFGVAVAGLVATGLALVGLQIFVIDAFCSLCLASAAISLVVAALAAEEILATIGWLRMETGLGRPFGDALASGERLEWWAREPRAPGEPRSDRPTIGAALGAMPGGDAHGFDRAHDRTGARLVDDGPEP